MLNIWNINKNAEEIGNTSQDTLSLPPNWKKVKHSHYVSWRPGPQTKGWEHLQNNRNNYRVAP